MKKKCSLLILSTLLFTSCVNYNENVSNKYEGKTPYLNVSKVENIDLTSISSQKYIELFNNGTTFICLLGTDGCSACKASKEHYLLPYIEQTKNEIYYLDVYDDFNRPYLSAIKDLQPSESDYIYYNSNNELVVKRPLLQIISNREVIVYEMGVSKNLTYMLESYIL